MSTKSCMTVLAILLGSTALTIPSNADAALKGYLGNVRPLADWRIGQVKAPTADLPGYCASVNQFEKGIVLALAQNQEGHLSLAIDFARPRFKVGQVQSVSLKHGDGYTVQAKGLAVNNKSLVIQLGQDPVFLRAMAQEGHLMLGLSDVDMKVSLMTFENSLRKLDDCVNNLPAQPRAIQEAQAAPAPALLADKDEDSIPASAEVTSATAQSQPEKTEAVVKAANTDEPAQEIEVSEKTPDPVPDENKITWNDVKALPEDTPAYISIPVKTAKTVEPTPSDREELDKAPLENDLERAAMAAKNDEVISSVVRELDTLIETNADGDIALRDNAEITRVEALQKELSRLVAARDAESRRANELAQRLAEVEAAQQQAAADKIEKAEVLPEKAEADKTRTVSQIQDELLMRQQDLERQARAQAAEAEWLEQRRLDVEKRMDQSAEDETSQEMIQQLAELEAQNKQLKQSYQAAKAKIVELDLEAETSEPAERVENRAPDQHLSALNEQLSLKESEIAGLQQRVEKQKRQEEAERKEAALEAEAIKDREARLALLHNQLDTKEAEIIRLQTLLADEKQNDLETAENEDLSSQQDEEEQQLSELSLQVDQKRSELESLQVAMEEQKKLQKAYQASLAEESDVIKISEITWNAPPALQVIPAKVVIQAPSAQAAQSVTPDDPKPEVIPVRQAKNDRFAEDREARAKDLGAALTKKIEPRAGAAKIVSDDIFYLEGQVESVHQPGALAIYRHKAQTEQAAVYLQGIEPAAGGVTTYVEGKAVETAYTEMQNVSLKPAQILNAGLQKILANADVKVDHYTDDMRHDGVGYQRNWKTAGLEGQFALYENMNSDRFMSYVSNFLNAYEVSNCKNATLSRNLKMISNDIVTAELNCEAKNSFGSIVFFKDESGNLSIITHRGAFDSLETIKQIKASLAKEILVNSKKYQNLKNQDNVPVGHIFENATATDSEEI